MFYAPTHAAVIDGEFYGTELARHTTRAASGPFVRQAPRPSSVDGPIFRPAGPASPGVGVIIAVLLVFAALGTLGFLLGVARAF